MDLSAYKSIHSKLKENNVKLVAVSKTKPSSDIELLYNKGQRIFGENKAQEMSSKAEELPEDIEWHMIGHLQRNKVKYIVPYVSLIHSVDSLRLLKEINKQGKKVDRKIAILLQMHIADEESKFGLTKEKLQQILDADPLENYPYVEIVGLMGMATFTEDKNKVRKEFQSLKRLFEELKAGYFAKQATFSELSMGMSGDYEIAIEEGSTMVRIWSKKKKKRDYQNW
mgnify:CR=1 FL=1